MDHKVIQRIPKTAEAGCKLACCLLKLSESQIHLFHDVDVEYQVAEDLSRLNTIGRNSTMLENEVPIFIISLIPLAYGTWTEHHLQDAL